MSNVLTALCAEAWAITEPAARAIAKIAQRAHERPEVIHKRAPQLMEGAEAGTTVANGVAAIPIIGPIFPRANLFTDISGATSLEVRARDFVRAMEDPDVSHIVLEIDSPGGQVTGVGEFAALVRNSDKPVTAYVTGGAHSAAYWIASQADEIVMAPSALAGSIGAIVAFEIDSETESIVFRSTQSPKKQADPASEEGAAEYQAIVDDIAAVFIADVAQGRGVSVETVLAEFGQGSSMVGQKAVSAGLADRLMTAEALLAEITKPQTLTHQNGGIPMSEDTKQVISQELIASDHQAIAQAFRAEGAEQERARIQAVLAQSLPGHEALIQELAFDGQTSGPEAAVKVLQAEKSAKEARLDAVQKDGRAVKIEASAEEPDTSNLPLEDRCKAEWQKSASLRAEFGGDFDRYLSFSRATAEGSVRILKNKRGDQ